MVEISHRLNAAPSNLGRENRLEPAPPDPHRLMRDVDAALVQQVFDFPQRQRETHLHRDRHADDLGRGFEVAKNCGSRHAKEGRAAAPTGKRIFL